MAPEPRASGPASSAILVEFLERSPIVVEGPGTGRAYRFSAHSPVQAVDPRDAAGFLGTRFFRLL